MTDEHTFTRPHVGPLDTEARGVFQSEEVEVGQLPDGARFRMSQLGAFDPITRRCPIVGWRHGTKEYTVGQSRARVKWDGQAQQVKFRQADGTEHDFTATRSSESNLPVSVLVEPTPCTRGKSTGGNMADSTVEVLKAKAKAIQTRYEFQHKALTAAVESGDMGKVEMVEGRIAKIVAEAAELDIVLVDPNADAPAETEAPAPVGKVKVGGKAKDNPEEAQTMANKKAAGEKAAGKPSLKEQNATRLAALKAKKANEPKVAKEPRAKKLDATHDCLCGCGLETGGKFRPGHDARVKGMLYKVERGEAKFDELPDTLKPHVKMAGKETSDYRIVSAPVKFPGRDDIKVV